MTTTELYFACESIAELLEFAEKTLKMKKASAPNEDQGSKRGIYGLSITILMACAFDAMGKIENKNGGNKARFEYIQNNYVNNNGYGFSNNQFVDIFYKVYRNGLVHSGTLQTGFFLENNEKEKIVYDANQNVIHVQALVKMAKEIFEQLKTQRNLQPTSGQYLNSTTTGDTQTQI